MNSFEFCCEEGRSKNKRDLELSHPRYISDSGAESSCTVSQDAHPLILRMAKILKPNASEKKYNTNITKRFPSWRSVSPTNLITRSGDVYEFVSAAKKFVPHCLTGAKPRQTTPPAAARRKDLRSLKLHGGAPFFSKHCIKAGALLRCKFRRLVPEGLSLVTDDVIPRTGLSGALARGFEIRVILVKPI